MKTSNKQAFLKIKICCHKSSLLLVNNLPTERHDLNNKCRCSSYLTTTNRADHSQIHTLIHHLAKCKEETPVSHVVPLVADLGHNHPLPDCGNKGCLLSESSTRIFYAKLMNLKKILNLQQLIGNDRSQLHVDDCFNYQEAMICQKHRRIKKPKVA